MYVRDAFGKRFNSADGHQEPTTRLEFDWSSGVAQIDWWSGT